MFTRIGDDHDAIRRAWLELKRSLGQPRDLNFFGVFESSIEECRVSAQSRPEDDPDAFGLETGMVAGGTYLRARIRGGSSAALRVDPHRSSENWRTMGGEIRTARWSSSTAAATRSISCSRSKPRTITSRRYSVAALRGLLITTAGSMSARPAVTVHRDEQQDVRRENRRRAPTSSAAARVLAPPRSPSRSTGRIRGPVRVPDDGAPAVREKASRRAMATAAPSLTARSSRSCGLGQLRVVGAPRRQSPAAGLIGCPV